MTNREKIMTVFKGALSSILPGNLIRNALRCVGDVLTIEGKKYCQIGRAHV
jgi:hypothetical protein